MEKRNSFHIWLIPIFLLMLTGFVQAAENTSEGSTDIDLSEKIDLPTLIQLAYQRNPRIKAVHIEWLAAIEKIPQATSLPDPMLMYGYFLRNVETRVGAQRQRFGISQSFPYPGTLHAMGEVKLKQVQIQEKKYEQVVRDVIVSVKLSYHELAYLERATEITIQNQELLNHIVKITATRYAQGEATFNDLLKAQSQQSQLSYDVILLRELREVEQANILSLLDLPPGTPLGPPAPLPYRIMKIPLDVLNQRGLIQRQEIQMAELMSQKAEKAIKLAKMKNKPMFKLDLMTVDTGKSIMFNTPDDGKNPWLISLGLSLPIWGAKKDSRVREAELNQQVVVQNKHQMEVKLMANLKKIYFRMENSRRLVELYENALIPQVEKAIEIAETWHQEDNPKSIAGLLETQSVWLNFNLARERAIADYQQNLTRLEQLVGGSLEDGEAGERGSEGARE